MWRSVALVAVVGCGSSQAKPAPPSPPPPRVEKPAPVVERTPVAAEPAVPKSGCDDVPDLNVDGLIDEWKRTRVVARIGSPSDGAMELHCAWDGSTLAVMADVKDDRVVRVRGGHEDHVSVTIAAGGKPVVVDVFPGNSMAKPKITKPAKVSAADSLQPKGFSVEVAIPGAAIPNMQPATAALELSIVFTDSDAATGANTTPLEVKQPIELSDRKDLFDDFLAAVKLAKRDITLDVQAELDPDRKGKERLVAGGTAIGVITDQFAFVTLPAATPADVKKVELLPLGPNNQQVIAAVVKQSGNGGSRDLLMLWTVWSGQLEPLGQIEIKKQLGTSTLESGYRIAKGRKGPELIVEPKPAVGFTPETWNEEPATDAEPIVLPWDTAKGGVAYYLRGKQLDHRDLPAPKKKQD